jgi:Arc/MetJ family transcription regulator
MRTNIGLDEDLVREGLKLSPVRTKRELVHLRNPACGGASFDKLRINSLEE